MTIAGSDSGGGAGIQADIKTFQESGVFGMTVVTAVTAQNTHGVHGIYPLPAEAVVRQMDAVSEDLKPDAVKTGMLHNAEIIEAVAERIKSYGWGNLVIDPVLIAKGGASLLMEDAVQALIKHLIPLAKVITPNIPEAETIAGMAISSHERLQEAARRIHGMGAACVVIKGGHSRDEQFATDVLYDGRQFTAFTEKRIATRHTHGTGCTFSAAIAAELAKGRTVEQAVKSAKRFIQAAIEDSLEIGGGHGPVNHWAFRQRRC